MSEEQTQTDRERAEALAERIYALRGENFILGAHKGGDCYRETCDCIANDLAAEFAKVRAEATKAERERCAKVFREKADACDSLDEIEDAILRRE